MGGVGGWVGQCAPLASRGRRAPGRALSCAVRAFRWRHALPPPRQMIDAAGSQWAEGRQSRGALRLVVSRGIKGDKPALRPFFPGALVEVRVRRGGSGSRVGLGRCAERSGSGPGPGLGPGPGVGSGPRRDLGRGLAMGLGALGPRAERREGWEPTCAALLPGRSQLVFKPTGRSLEHRRDAQGRQGYVEVQLFYENHRECRLGAFVGRCRGRLGAAGTGRAGLWGLLREISKCCGVSERGRDTR